MITKRVLDTPTDAGAQPADQPAVTSVRIQSGSGAAFCCGKSTQIVVAPPAAQITPGWSARSIVPQVSNVVRPGSLT
jgi:hypothetical protein